MKLFSNVISVTSVKQTMQRQPKTKPRQEWELEWSMKNMLPWYSLKCTAQKYRGRNSNGYRIFLFVSLAIPDDGIQTTWNMTVIINWCHLTILLQRKELMNKFKYAMRATLHTPFLISLANTKYHKLLE